MRSLREDFGIELRRRRMAAGMSLRDLAAEIHYSRGYISKVENGQRASAGFAQLCDSALNAGGELAARVDHQASVATVTDPMATWGMEMGVNQRSWFTVRDASVANSVLTTFLGWFDDFRGLGQRSAPGLVLPMLIPQTHTLRRLAAAAGLPGRPAFFRLAARYAEYTGWMAQEAGDDAAAVRWTNLAAGMPAPPARQATSS